jgi:hypothetical protein
MAAEEINHGYSNLWLQIHVILMGKLNADNAISQPFGEEVCDEKKSKNKYGNFVFNSLTLHSLIEIQSMH